jgi:hypothetical protein
MICPVCKGEYRREFTHCVDCDVDLVQFLPVPGEFDEATSHKALSSADQPLEKVWSGDDQQSCVSICTRLRNADIPYRVSEQNRQDLRVREQYFVIFVSPSDVQMATETAHEGKFDFDDSEQDQAIMELPARDDLPVEEVHGDGDPKNWYPEDATLEVWGGNPKDKGFVVEMSLKENRINYRVVMESDELKRVFVMPEDEARAREIVREIVEGTPPE